MVENKTVEELASEEVATKDTAAEVFKKKEKKRKRNNWITLLVLLLVVASAITWFHRTYTNEMAELDVYYQRSMQEEYTEEDLAALAFLLGFKDSIDVITSGEDERDESVRRNEARACIGIVGQFLFYEKELEDAQGVTFSSLSPRGKIEIVTTVKKMYESVAALDFLEEKDIGFGENYVFFAYIEELLLDRGVSTLDKAMDKLYMGDETSPIAHILYYKEKVRVHRWDDWVWTQIDKVSALFD